MQPSERQGHVFETGIRQFRMAMSMVWAKPINPRNVEHLITDVHNTLGEFGAPGDDVQQLLDGPFVDPAARSEFLNRALQVTTRRLKRTVPFYRQLFAEHDIDPETITIADMARIPVTLKHHLQAHQRDLLATDAQPYMTTRTTGTTGKPTEIWISRYELDMWTALAALSGLLRGEIKAGDCLQINLSSRATAAVQMNMRVASLSRARARVLGIIPPDDSLDSLASGADAPTHVNSYPSYIAQLIKAAQARKLGPRDFQLRSVIVGGEPLSPALATAIRDVLGATPVDTFGMTEVLPVTGRVCSQRHMHFDLNMGYVEVIDLDTGLPAKPGAYGTVVVTPFYPYRECMPVLRYDTRDVVRQLPEGSLTCEFAAIPATSHILGKADHLLRIGDQIVAMRDLVEAYESLPSQPWPARFNAHVVDDHIELVIPAEALAGSSKEKAERHFQQAGLEVRIAETVTGGDVGHTLFRPLRADLIETTFSGRR